MPNISIILDRSCMAPCLSCPNQRSVEVFPFLDWLSGCLRKDGISLQRPWKAVAKVFLEFHGNYFGSGSFAGTCVWTRRVCDSGQLSCKKTLPGTVHFCEGSSVRPTHAPIYLITNLVNNEAGLGMSLQLTERNRWQLLRTFLNTTLAFCILKSEMEVKSIRSWAARFTLRRSAHNNHKRSLWSWINVLEHVISPAVNLSSCHGERVFINNSVWGSRLLWLCLTSLHRAT